MNESTLKFVVTNDPELNFDLVQEAWINDRLTADVRYVNGNWQVTFFQNNQFCEISWTAFEEIHKAFSKFINENKL